MEILSLEVVFEDHSAGRKGGKNLDLLQTVPLLHGNLQNLQLSSYKNLGLVLVWFCLGYFLGLVFLLWGICCCCFRLFGGFCACVCFGGFLVVLGWFCFFLGGGMSFGGFCIFTVN